VLIVHDFQIFVAQLFGGISRYHCELVAALARCDGVQARIVAPLHSNVHLHELAPPTSFTRYIPRLPATTRAMTAMDALLFRSAAAWLRPDVVHETFYSATPTSRGRAPRVLTVHDLINVRFAAHFSASDPTAELQRRAVARADRIICVSENTRRDLLEDHGVDPARVSVVHHGFSALRAGSETAEALVGPRPYLLFVGTRGHYKNFEGLLRAYALSSRLRDGFRLVCVGGGRFTSDDLALIARLGVRDGDVVQLSCRDDQLAALYTGAAAFVYPSRYEGFGIPLLEAMSLDCPVVCSDRSSVPEVAGPAAEYFDPEMPEAIAAAIERVVESPARRAELVRLGRARCATFSWARSARETLDVYRGVAG
jgi:glycosyltransferase involved in cell wall biosynthesis